MADSTADPKPSPLREITQPFVDLVHAPRALWGVNLGYFLEGLVYFGMLGYLAIYFSDFVFRGMKDADVYSHDMVGVLTAGITISMFFLGFVADRFGVRRALIWAFLCMLAGRILIAGAPTIGLEPAGLWSTLHVVTMVGILMVVIGYGMYQPAAYAAVRQFTNPKTAGMAFAMLYALMNLGGYLPSWAFLLRDDDYLGLGITGVFWVYTSLTVVALVATAVILSRRTVTDAIARAKQETAAIKAHKAEKAEQATPATAEAASEAAPIVPPTARVPVHWWGLWAVCVGVALYFLHGLAEGIVLAVLAACLLAVIAIPAVRQWVIRHPLSDVKFFFFIFALIPVQTLFAYNWLILPQYISRAYEGWIGEYFELASNFNPILVFIFVPIVTALTEKRKVYNMMIIGTAVMAAPAFLLTLGTTWYLLFGYLLIMTIGESMWQPRFLQYAAEIAPEGRTGVYMGVAQFPWFLTKVIVPLYSGHLIARYVPAEGAKNPETLWLISACIAMSSTVLLIAAKGWLGKGFKTKADD